MQLKKPYLKAILKQSTNGIWIERTEPTEDQPWGRIWSHPHARWMKPVSKKHFENAHVGKAYKYQLEEFKRLYELLE